MDLETAEFELSHTKLVSGVHCYTSVSITPQKKCVVTFREVLDEKMYSICSKL